MSQLGPGALVWAGFDGEHAPGPLLDALRDGVVGGVLLFAARKNLREREQVRAMLREIHDATQRGGLPPVPVAVDQEGGTVVRVGYRAVFPSAMAIGATREPDCAERAARAVAGGLRADGITVNHAPVCDVNSEPGNPVVGTRAFGDDPERVSAFAAAWVRGSESAGVATTPKHFPGHGDTTRDSHLALPEVGAERKTLVRRELTPFRAAFAAGASGVMTAHVRYPALDPSNPATLSHAILAGVLRHDLAFDGLCVTDSLDMAGVSEIAPPREIVVASIRAGVDAVMVTSGLDRQLAAGRWIAESLRPDRVREAIRRATVFRERFGSAVPQEDVDDAPARTLAAEIAAASITHVGPQLPRFGGPLRVIYLTPARVSVVEELADPVGTLEAALRRRLGNALGFARDGAIPNGPGPLVVCSTNAAFEKDQARRISELLHGEGVLCAMRSPYDAALVPDRPALLTYGDVPVSLDALAAVLAGERSARGRLPVRLS